MVEDVPQWLIQAFVRSVQHAGSTQDKEYLAQACRDLVARWKTGDRHYHGVSHVVELLSRLETLLPETHHPDLLRIAAWYHGIIFSTSSELSYTRRGGENEIASAEVAYEQLRELGVEEQNAQTIRSLIASLARPEANAKETTQFHTVDVDELALRDAHLGTLAVEPQRYKKYLEEVAAEYAHIPYRDFLHARTGIVTRLLARNPLYCTPLARAWENQARENLEAERERIRALLKKIDEKATLSHPAHSPSSSSGHTFSEAASSAFPQTGEIPTHSALQQTSPSELSESTQDEFTREKPTLTDPSEQENTPRERLRLPVTIKEDSSGISTMENCRELFDPGLPERECSEPEEYKTRMREKIAAQARAKIEERARAARAQK